MSSLTLCMIVKDEEAFLAGCLESVAGIADSIVVVDTGSTDATIAIARAHGAEVVQHEWNDDFAAARNAALAQVKPSKNRFVLILDADERLTPASITALRRALKRADFDLGLLPLHDASKLDAEPNDIVAGRARRGEPVLLPRLLRFDPTLRYEGRVHEQVTTWSRQRGRRIAPIEAPIVHYGAVPELRSAKGKSDRNRALLERRAQDEPNNPIVRAYLAREYERAGDAQRALEEARASWTALLASAANGKPTCDAVLPVTMLAYFSIQNGDLDAAEQALSNARTWIDAHPNVELLSGLVHERRALNAPNIEAFSRELNAAHADYQRCLSLRGRTFAAEILPGACGTTGTTRLATVLLLAGDPTGARKHFDAVLHLDPRSVEARLGRAEAWIDEEQAQKALDELESLVMEGTADAWILSGAAAGVLGDRATARMLAERAQEIAKTKPWIGGWRRGRIDELLSEPQPTVPVAAAEIQRIESIAPEPVHITEPLRASVVIPCFNRFDLLQPVVQACVHERSRSGFQLVLVDDGSSTPVADLVRSMGVEYSLDLVRRENGGRGAALNDGLARATGNVIVFCDSDIVPTPGFVDQHLDFHRENRSELATHLGALEWGVDPGLFGVLTGARANPRLRGGSRNVDWTQWFTDNWSFKRSLLASRDLKFDLAYRAWGFEELDLARQLQQLGATNTLTTRARGLHLKPATSEGLRACFVRSVPNLLYLARKDPRDAHVRNWLSAHADADSVARAERAYEIVWQRLQELDTQHANVLRDVTSPPIDQLAIALSDATFQVGIARGLVANPDLVRLHADILPAPSPTKVLSSIEHLALRVEAIERRCGTRSTPGGWLTAVAIELGWNASSHALRDRWAAPVAAR